MTPPDEQRLDEQRVFILGAGRAGRGLARAFVVAGVPLVGLHGRHAEPAGEGPAITAGRLPDELAHATAVLVAVRDAQLDAALRELLAAPLAPGAVVLHASGVAEPAALEAVRAAGHPAGTFHPLLPLADPATAPARLRGAFVGIDGDAEAQRTSRALAGRIGARVLAIPRGEKARYHAAAVIASNFPTVLAALASGILREIGIAEPDAWDAVRALLSASAANLEGRTAADALTGPIARGDAATVERHLAALASDAPALAAYRALSRVAVDLSRTRGVDPAALAEIDRSLG